jgi:hypothetical protein
MSPQVNEEPARDIPNELKRLDHYITRHGESISSVIERVMLMDARLKLVEEYWVTRKIAEAREDERDKALYERLDRTDADIKALRSEVKDMKGVGAKALWVIAGAVLLAVTTWVIKGGLA